MSQLASEQRTGSLSGISLAIHLLRETKVTGKVKWFDDVKGYGFIGRTDGPDVFVHYTSIICEGHRTLREGDLVQFDIVQGTKGPQAANVSLLPKARES
jgi:CspA family cold shock protein